MQNESIINHNEGHRKRLRERFLLSPTSVPDYEILEMILFWSVPRKDVKTIAKTLLKEFSSLSAVINAPSDKLLSIDGVTDTICANFKLLREILRRKMQSGIINKNILSTWDDLIEYLQLTQGVLQTEQFRILFLNKKNILIADELQEFGTVDQTAVYPREIVKRALFHEASAIILVHNHPSGNPSPSKADLVMTKEIVAACKTLSIIVHDHVIICSGGFYSFKSNMLL